MEKVHNGKKDNAVVYIPAGPDCTLNRAYLEKMKESFGRGTTPPDLVNYGNTGREITAALFLLVLAFT